jgi:dTDP-4-dehydrorhamnose reductase
MKILVTGSNGLLGQKLTSLLQNDPEIELIATARSASVIPVQGIFEILNIEDRDEVDRILTYYKPDVVINAAAMTQVDQCEDQQEECWRANVTAVENLTNACNAINSFFIHVSTDFIFDGSYGPLDENAVPNPVNFYGKSKLAAETYIQEHAKHWSILRTVLVFGITQDMSRSNIVLWVKNSLEANKTIQVVNDQWRTPTLAEDLAIGCYLAAKKRVSGIFHISGDKMMTPYDIAIETANFFNLDKSMIIPTDGSKFQQRAKRPAKTGFIIQKAKEKLGYTPHTFLEGLQIVSNQIKSHSQQKNQN